MQFSSVLGSCACQLRFSRSRVTAFITGFTLNFKYVTCTFVTIIVVAVHHHHYFGVGVGWPRT